MKKLITALAVLVMAGQAGALAQSRKSMRSTDSMDRPSAQAPVGHRQPRTNDVPNDKNMSDPIEAMTRDDAALDRKIKSICRGC